MSENINIPTEAKLNDLKNVHRLVSNTINLINEVEIKGAYAGPVAEILGWLDGFKATLAKQMEVLQSLPVLDAEVVQPLNK